jgi:tellurite resistance protein
MGAVVLTAAAAAHAAGFATAGWTLGLLVAALALLAAVTGFCTGCEIYRLIARVRGVGHGELRRIDRADVGEAAGEIVVHFTHPLCSDCLDVERRLRSEGRTLVTVDVRRRPDLARKYGIGIVPTAVAVAADGAITARLA